MKPKLLDLFSGIGGFSLGLERAGFETVAFCEIDSYCRTVLKRHWPNVPCYEDVRSLTAERLRTDGISVDAICGGFPCQDISLAGQGAGIDGERSGLWSEYARIVGELRPAIVIVENVAALLGRGLGRVLGDLAALGYDAEWHCIPASAVGLPHTRDRVWIVAHDRKERGQGHIGQTLSGLYGIPWGENERRATRWRERPDLYGPRLCLRRNGLSEELGAYGNAVVPQIPEAIGRAIIKSLVHEMKDSQPDELL